MEFSSTRTLICSRLCKKQKRCSPRRHVIRKRKIDLRLAVFGHFEAVERQIVIAALQSRDETVPLVLDEDGRAIEFGAERRGEIDLESDRLARVLRILKNVGRAAFGIAAPAQFFALSE